MATLLFLSCFALKEFLRDQDLPRYFLRWHCPGGIDALFLAAATGAAAQIVEENLGINTERFPLYFS
jgi:hypothetical protein